jgi:hypothetical protein
MRVAPVLIATLAGMAWSAAVAAQKPATKAAAHDSSGRSTSADSLRYRFRLLGVYDETSGAPIADVEVTDILSGTKSMTTATGTVSLFFLPDGGSLVRLRKVGYEVQTIPVSIAPGDTTPITIVLNRVVSLPTVKVNADAPTYRSPALRAAAERMTSGMGGYFIDEATLRKEDNSTLANVIRSRVAGLMAIAGPSGATFFVSSRQQCLHALHCAGPNCVVTTYIDGIPSTITPDFNRLSPAEYAMVEFYPGGSTIPPEFGGTDSPCGALLLWTREK